MPSIYSSHSSRRRRRSIFSGRARGSSHGTSMAASAAGTASPTGATGLMEDQGDDTPTRRLIDVSITSTSSSSPTTDPAAVSSSPSSRYITNFDAYEEQEAMEDPSTNSVPVQRAEKHTNDRPSTMWEELRRSMRRRSSNGSTAAGRVRGNRPFRNNNNDASLGRQRSSSKSPGRRLVPVVLDEYKNINRQSDAYNGELPAKPSAFALPSLSSSTAPLPPVPIAPVPTRDADPIVDSPDSLGVLASPSSWAEYDSMLPQVQTKPQPDADIFRAVTVSPTDDHRRTRIQQPCDVDQISNNDVQPPATAFADTEKLSVRKQLDFETSRSSVASHQEAPPIIAEPPRAISFDQLLGDSIFLQAEATDAAVAETVKTPVKMGTKHEADQQLVQDEDLAENDSESNPSLTQEQRPASVDDDEHASNEDIDDANNKHTSNDDIDDANNENACDSNGTHADSMARGGSSIISGRLDSPCNGNSLGSMSSDGSVDSDDNTFLSASFSTPTQTQEIATAKNSSKNRTVRFADEAGLPMFEIFSIGGPNDPNALHRTIVMLLSPANRQFEFIQAEFRIHSQTTVADFLEQLPNMATNPVFQTQSFTSICRTEDNQHCFSNSDVLRDCEFYRNEVLVAVNKGHEVSTLLQCAMPLLRNDRITKAVKFARRSGRGLKYIRSREEMIHDAKQQADGCDEEKKDEEKEEVGATVKEASEEQKSDDEADLAACKDPPVVETKESSSTDDATADDQFKDATQASLDHLKHVKSREDTAKTRFDRMQAKRKLKAVNKQQPKDDSETNDDKLDPLTEYLVNNDDSGVVKLVQTGLLATFGVLVSMSMGRKKNKRKQEAQA